MSYNGFSYSSDTGVVSFTATDVTKAALSNVADFGQYVPNAGKDLNAVAQQQRIDLGLQTQQILQQAGIKTDQPSTAIKYNYASSGPSATTDKGVV
jgi:hypothetical protein